jgi:hypothetical protein
MAVHGSALNGHAGTARGCPFLGKADLVRSPADVACWAQSGNKQIHRDPTARDP